MSRDEIMRLSGRELDAAVAERVMRWPIVVPDDGENWFERQVTKFPSLICHRQGGQWLARHSPRESLRTYDEQWHPSTDRNCAAEVLAEIEKRGLLFSVCEWIWTFNNLGGSDGIYEDECTMLLIVPPEQICKAALLAVEEVDAKA